MSLRPSELAQVVQELSLYLTGAVVQKVHSPSSKRCYLELRQVGSSTLLALCTEAEVGRLSVTDARLASPPEGSSFQRRLRNELVGMRLTNLFLSGPREVVLQFDKPPLHRTLFAEIGGRGDLVLMDEQGRPVAASEPRFLVARAKGEARAEPTEALASRLVASGDVPLPLARAAEVLFGAKEDALRLAAARRLAVDPLKSKLQKLERTLVKVRAEADRLPKAEEHRRLGELLSQNLFHLQRGAGEVELTEYTAVGENKIRLKLDPSRTPKAEAERHFHQYRRLLRGCEQASLRLGVLDEERRVLEQRLAQALAATPELSNLPVSLERQKNKTPVAVPFKSYLSTGGRRILVGKGKEDNDALSFKVARPQDLWLHARGVPGAHVVVPLNKGEAVSTDLLLDAAHLAHHHSQNKGEPRSEVLYTHAKFVKKPKGSAPGLVTHTREKTFLLRVEPDRLERLLKTQTS